MPLQSLFQKLSQPAAKPPTVPDAGPRFPGQSFAPPAIHPLPSFRAFENLLTERYHTDRLVTQDAEQFRRRIDEFLQLSDYQMEGLTSRDRQRDLTINFQWGHDTDFGTFALQGPMGKNHIHAVSTFTDHLKALPLDLRGMRVLDIGVWTGGTSLLLAAMGAEVVAVEEVKKYCDCLEYVASAFGIRNLIVKHVSLYDCTGPDYDDRFDFVLFPGVLYHLSDPIIALRILFNALRDGGTLLLQSKAIDSPQSICYYQVHRFSEADSKGDLRGKRWSWFFPSSPAVANMLQDVGFMDATVTRVRNGVLAAVAKRVRHVEMTRAGLALRHIR